MAVHRANLDRLAATGLPIQVTELDIDGVASGGTPGDAVQLRNYRRIVPTFWEHPGVEGITVWGWRQPNHWRNAQNAPIVLSDDTPKPAAHWLYDYVRKIAPVIPADQRFTVTDAYAASVGTVAAEDWASAMGRPELRTFTWRITDDSDGRFAIVPATGELRVAQPSRLDEHSTYPLKVRVSDGFHESEEVTVSVATGRPHQHRRHDRRRDRAGDAVADARRPGDLRAVHPGGRARLRGEPRRHRDQHRRGGEPQRRRSRARHRGAAGQRRLRARPAPSGRDGRRVRPHRRDPANPARYNGPVSNDQVTIRLKQAIGATEALRTGAYAKTLTFTVSTTAP